MPTLSGLIEQARRDGAFRRVMNNPLAQFGPPTRNYLGATLLPEVNRPENQFTERGIRWRSVVANAGTRYGPVQRKRSFLIGSFDVKLGNSDIGDTVSSEDFDVFVDELESRGENAPATVEDLARVLGWVDAIGNIPLVEHNEKNRWDCLVSAQVTLQGDDQYEEVVSYANPTGHRRAALNQWSNNANDPWPDIIAQVNLLKGKGYTVNRIITGADVISILSANTNVQRRVGLISIASGTVVGLAGIAGADQINAALRRDGLPPMEEYNLTYNTQTTSGYFLPRGTMVFCATTGREQRIDLGDNTPIPPIQNTLGYLAVGRPAGRSVPGRTVYVQAFEDKPPRVDIQAWQTSLPVLTEPEAVAVITGIN